MKTNEMTTVRQLTAWAWKPLTLAIILAAFDADRATAQTNIPAPLGAQSDGTTISQPSGAGVQRVRGLSVIAAFDAYGPSGCTYQNVFVSALKEQDIQSGSGADTREYTRIMPINISAADLCLNVVTCVAYGIADQSGVELQADADLKSARLRAHWVLFDMISFEMFPVDVVVEFTGTGELIRDHRTAKYEVPGGVQMVEVFGKFRPATAVGYFFVHDPWTGGTNMFPTLAPCVSVLAEIDLLEATIVTNVKPQP